MSSEIPVELFPVVLCQDRYGGVYSRGAWWAVAQADEQLEGLSRIDWLWQNGASSDDVTASVFWAHQPDWIAVGKTPDEAISKLRMHPNAGDTSWMPPPIEADPRWKESFRPQT